MFVLKRVNECFVWSELLMSCRACQYSFQKTRDSFLETIQDAVGVELEWVRVFSK